MEIAFQTSKKFFRPFLNKLIFNSFSSFRLRAGFDAGVMERFLFPSSFQMLILTEPKRRKKKMYFLVNESGIDCILHTWQLHSGFQLHFA
jgi:hypothetical protein